MRCCNLLIEEFNIFAFCGVDFAVKSSCKERYQRKDAEKLFIKMFASWRFFQLLIFKLILHSVENDTFGLRESSRGSTIASRSILGI